MTTAKTSELDEIAKKVHALGKLANELRGGASFEITKLTVLKSLCAERTPRVLFAHHVAALSLQAMKPKARSSGLSATEWEDFRHEAANAVQALERYAKHPNAEPPTTLHNVLADVH